MAGGDIDDVEGALAAIHAEEVAPAPSEAVRRLAIERRASEPKDGRSLRYVGRSVQLNVRVRPETKAALDRASKEHAAPITYIIEQALVSWIAAQDRSKRGGKS